MHRLPDPHTPIQPLLRHDQDEREQPQDASSDWDTFVTFCLLVIGWLCNVLLCISL